MKELTLESASKEQIHDSLASLVEEEVVNEETYEEVTE